MSGTDEVFRDATEAEERPDSGTKTATEDGFTFDVDSHGGKRS